MKIKQLTPLILHSLTINTISQEVYQGFQSGSCDYNKYVSIILYSTTPLHRYKLKTNVIPATTFSCGTKKGTTTLIVSL